MEHRLLQRLQVWSEAHTQPIEQPSPPEETAIAAAVSSPARYASLKALLDPIFLVILAGAALLRFYGLNWDQNTHLHPDERFLTMVGNAQRLPSGVAQYLDPASSPLNPANLGPSFQFFVYGAFPVSLNKLLAVIFHNDTYDGYALQGRFLSALADTIVVILVYLTVLLLERRYNLPRSLKYWSAFFYAIAVLPIQLGHFFAVDSFLNLFMMASFYFALRYSFEGGTWNALLSAALFGFALGCKTTGIFLFPLNACLLIIGIIGESSQEILTLPTRQRLIELLREHGRSWALEAGSVAIVYAAVSYVALRVADPYIFQSSNIFNPTISQLFLHNLDQLRSFDTPDAWYPPGVQWIHKTPVVFSLVNVAFFGVGVASFLFVVVGVFQIWRGRGNPHLVVFTLWGALFFLFQSVQYVKTMRYFIFLYPFLAIFAAIGFERVTRRVHRGYAVALFVAVLVWPLAFMSIYTRDHSRVDASKWMYSHLPNNSMILSEEWDDGLPMPVSDTFGKTYNGQQLPVFGQDTPDKWVKMDTLLAKGDYLVLTSNRGWGSMPTVPERYPIMTSFYRELLAGKPVHVPAYRTSVSKGQTTYQFIGNRVFKYRKIAEFTSYPSLRYLGLPVDFPDQWSEEAFTVYDHPKVMLFQHIR